MEKTFFFVKSVSTRMEKRKISRKAVIQKPMVFMPRGLRNKTAINRSSFTLYLRTESLLLEWIEETIIRVENSDIPPSTNHGYLLDGSMFCASSISDTIRDTAPPTKFLLHHRDVVMKPSLSRAHSKRSFLSVKKNFSFYVLFFREKFLYEKKQFLDFSFEPVILFHEKGRDSWPRKPH